MNNFSIHSNNDIKKTNINLIVSLIPIIIYSLIVFKLDALIIIASGLIPSILADFIIMRKDFKILTNFNLVSSLILVLMIPLSMPFYVVIVLSLVNIILRNILKKYKINIPVTLIIILNTYLIISNKLPVDYNLKNIFNLLIDAKTNIMAFNAPILLIISFIYLTIKNNLKYLIVLSSIIIFALINPTLNIDYLINGSFIFISIYLLSDTMFSSMYRISQIISGILNAIITSILLSFKFQNGILVSTLIISLLAPLIDILYVRLKTLKK